MSTATASGQTRSRARLSGRARERAVQWMFLVPAILYVAIFFLFPVVKNFTMALQEYTTKTFYTGEAPWVGLANYAEILGSSIFTKSLANTFLFTLGSIAGQFTIGLLLAVFFNRRFPLSGFLRSILLIPWLLPVIASTAVWKWILDQDGGVLNQALKGLGIVDSGVPWISSPSVALVSVILVNVWLGIPFSATLLYSGLQEIPTELYEAGALDGATGWRAFWSITWPNLRSVVLIVLTLNVIYTLKVLDVIVGLTGGGPANATQTLATDSYRRSFHEFSFGTGAAVSNVLILVSLTFALVYLRINRTAADE